MSITSDFRETILCADSWESDLVVATPSAVVQLTVGAASPLLLTLSQSYIYSVSLSYLSYLFTFAYYTPSCVCVFLSPASQRKPWHARVDRRWHERCPDLYWWDLGISLPSLEQKCGWAYVISFVMIEHQRAGGLTKQKTYCWDGDLIFLVVLYAFPVRRMSVSMCLSITHLVFFF